eukprot:1160861-Pelagomonas_calceolata.AAC.1
MQAKPNQGTSGQLDPFLNTRRLIAVFSASSMVLVTPNDFRDTNPGKALGSVSEASVVHDLPQRPTVPVCHICLAWRQATQQTSPVMRRCASTLIMQ